MIKMNSGPIWSLLLIAIAAADSADVCTSPNNEFHVLVDLFASELGQYTFKECPGVVNPVIGLEVGQVYTFVQDDRSNYYHPLGITQTPNTYLLGTELVQREVYERKFFEPSSIWAGYEEFSVTVTFSEDEQPEMPPSYYCLIHHGMDGRIQLLKNGQPLGEGTMSVKAADGGFVDTRSTFDKECGSYGLDQFQLPNPLCPDRFVCGTEGVSDELKRFSSCLEAANCAMMSGMTTGVRATDDSSLFVHQMIPHHKNAVNTAKTLLKMGSLLCPDLTDGSNPDCVLEGILREIVAGQNHQIQLMRRFLELHNFPPEDNCDVYVKTVELEDLVPESEKNGRSSGPSWTPASLAMGSTLLSIALGFTMVF